MELGSIVVCLCAVLIPALGQRSDFVSTCIGLNLNPTCKQSQIKINDVFYSCEMIKEVEGYIKRITVNAKDKIVFYAHERKFVYDLESKLVTEEENIPMTSLAIMDDRSVHYYVADRGVVAYDAERSKEIFVKTEDENNFFQLALNKNSRELFILSSGRSDYQDLHVLNTDKIKNATGDSVIADKVKGLQGIFTSIAAHDNRNLILLGLKLGNDGKLLLLKRLDADSCLGRDIYRDELDKILKDMNGRIISFYNRHMNKQSDSIVVQTNDKDVQKLSRENDLLKKKLDIAVKKLALYRRNIEGIRARTSEITATNSRAHRLEAAAASNLNSQPQQERFEAKQVASSSAARPAALDVFSHAIENPREMSCPNYCKTMDEYEKIAAERNRLEQENKIFREMMIELPAPENDEDI